MRYKITNPNPFYGCFTTVEAKDAETARMLAASKHGDAFCDPDCIVEAWPDTVIVAQDAYMRALHTYTKAVDKARAHPTGKNVAVVNILADEVFAAEAALTQAKKDAREHP